MDVNADDQPGEEAPGQAEAPGEDEQVDSLGHERAPAYGPPWPPLVGARATV
jgi:hypothetical protein